MKKIDNLKKARVFLVNSITDLSVEQLNEIPPGFNNNIIWNLGHMIAAQQGVCYLRSGAKMVVEEKYWNEYRPGTRPMQSIDAGEIQNIKDMMLTTIDQLNADRKKKHF